MKLIAFRIKNFKSIIDSGECRIPGDDILVLAGQNEAGKSAVLEALDFFRNGPSGNFNKLQRRQREAPEVVCKFGLEDGDIQAIRTTSELEPLLQTGQLSEGVTIVREFNPDTAENLLSFGPDTYALLQQIVRATPIEPHPDHPDKTLSGVSNDWPDTVTAKFLNFLESRMRDFVYFDAFSDLLPGEIQVSQIANYPAVLDFQKLFKVDFAKIAEFEGRAVVREELRLKSLASDDLNTYWSQITEAGSKYNFAVKVTGRSPVVNSSIQFMIDRDDGDPLYMEQKSKGFRWFSAFNLKLRALGVDESKIKNLVLLIDEPGQGLHEKAQRDVKNVIEELNRKGAQILYTTHHPNLIGTQGVEFTRIRLVSNSKDVGTKVETVAQFASRADGGSADTLSPIVSAMGIGTVGSLVARDKKSVIVEGITDHYYLAAFRSILHKSALLQFIPACGVNNVPNLASVLIGWGFDFKAILDDDAGAGRKAYNLLKKEFFENDDTLAHNHIYKLNGCNGIEDLLTPADFHAHVLDKALPEGVVEPNSKIVGNKKEMLARLFLEKVDKQAIELSQESLDRVSVVFQWLYQKFNLQ